MVSAGHGYRGLVNESVTVHIDAPASEVWSLVADVTRIGEYSPETFEAEWTDGATGPAVGARFRGHVKRNGVGPIYWSPCVVTVCAPDEEFAFSIERSGRALSTWGYRLAPTVDGGTDVTEYFELAGLLPLRIYWALMGWSRGRTNRNGMRTTLEAMKAELEVTGS